MAVGKVEVDLQVYDLQRHELVVDAIKNNKQNFHRGWIILNEAQISNWGLVCNFASGGYRIIKQKRMPGI